MTSASGATFPGVIGHERITEMFARATARDHLHHGLVFAGPPGIGKATLARGLACGLNCEVTPGLGCGTCDSCRRFLSSRHTDLARLEGEGKSDTIKADAARELALRAQRAPFEGKAHVIIVDPADRMQPAAVAALLKAIEEPRPGVHWILIATNLHNILDTIRSRCMTVPIYGLSRADVRRVVDRALADRAEPPDPRRVELAVSVCGGSPGLALQLVADGSLDATRDLLSQTLRAAAIGSQAIFSGDASPLWAAWKTAVVATPDPGERSAEDPELPEELVVVKHAGKKPKKKRAKKKAKPKGDPSKSSARQRATADRLAQLWMLHLRAQGSGDAGLEGVPNQPLAGTTLSQQMRVISKFQADLVRNPNVRLSFEQLLLRLGPC